jgi:kynureninase
VLLFEPDRRWRVPKIAMDDLLKFREEFPILDTATYLVSHSLGAMPRGARVAMKEFVDTWDARGVRAWEESWWMLAADVAGRIGALIGAPPGTVALHQNVTLTQAIIASCFDFSEPRNKVVMVDLEFPSIQYFYYEQQRRGARIELIRSDDGIHVPMEKLLAAIDEHTLLVPISLVLFRSSTLLDARAIIERAHRVGAHVVLDAFQAVGTVPVDVRAWHADFAVGGVLKWLCGGPGVAYLYVREDLHRKLAPSITGWFAHRRPFAFESGPIDRTDGSFRFLAGTTQIPALYACRPGLEIIARAGVENIRRKSQRLTASLIEGALARGWRVNTPLEAAERGGTVSIDCPNAAEVARELIARDILVDYRPGAGIRLAPHFYNRDDEVNLALEQMEEILRSGAWQRHAEAVRSATVT